MPQRGAHFARLCVESAYGAGAKNVVVRWNDDQTARIRMQRTADGRCLKQEQVIRGQGSPSAADRAPPAPSSPGCEPPPIPRDVVR